MPKPPHPEPFGMVAEHAMQPDQNVDSLRFPNGVTVRVTEDDDGVCIIHVTGNPDEHVWILYNNETVFDYTPDEEQRGRLTAARAAAEPPPLEQQLRKAVQARLANGDTVGVTSHELVLQEAAKLIESSTSAKQ